MNFKITSVLTILLLLVGTANAQFTGYTAELDTVFFGPDTPTPDDPFDPTGALEFYGTYKIYANFTNSSDVLSALYSDVGALNTPQMFIDAPCGCHNPVNTSNVMPPTNTSALWIGPFMDWEYDTYWTIGMESSDAPGSLPQSVGLPATGANICSDVTDNSSIFCVGVPSNAIAGDDLKILIAQVTTCGHFSLSACVQVFIEGDQQQIQYACPPLLEVTHIYDNGECVNDADGDGVCDEFEVIGCMEEDACNFDPAATDNTGGCDYSCYGCIDPNSCNFNPDATLDDGSCEYTSCAGCTDPNSCNYNPDATLDDGTCDYISCLGCTIVEACNYDPEALLDDGTCILPGDSCDDGEAMTFDDFIQDDCTCMGFGCHDEEACNYFPNSLPANSSCNYVALGTIVGPMNPNAITLVSYSYVPGNTSSTYEWVTTLGDVEDGEGTPNVEVAWWGDGIGTICVTETNSDGCSGETVCADVDINPVSVEDLDGNTALLVYPSPANTILTVSSVLSHFDNAEILLRDMTGRVVKTAQLNQQVTLNVSDLSAGTYLVQINTTEQSFFRRVLIE